MPFNYIGEKKGREWNILFFSSAIIKQPYFIEIMVVAMTGRWDVDKNTIKKGHCHEGNG